METHNLLAIWCISAVGYSRGRLREADWRLQSRVSMTAFRKWEIASMIEKGETEWEYGEVSDPFLCRSASSSREIAGWLRGHLMWGSERSGSNLGSLLSSFVYLCTI